MWLSKIILSLSIMSYICLDSIAVHAQVDASLWIAVWPSRIELPIQPSQVFLFSTSSYDFLKKAMQQLDSDIQVYLWSAHDSVPLRVHDRLSSANGNMRLLLQPERPLLMDSLYELRASRGEENVFYYFQQNEPTVPGRRGRTRYRWRVVSTPDTKAPIWCATPMVTKKVYEAWGEAPSNYVSFSYPLQDTSTCIIKAVVQHVRDGCKFTTYLKPWQNQLFLGEFDEDNFRFASGEDYNVTFEAIDAAGNRATANGSALPFQAPTKSPTIWGEY
ncbi:hypothetical protein [Hymenobacter sp. GOD-10R]|uniref:hypothetical protein n=1 Tax=Hymenobacter sp. GOD-10R TaxID=3093922 RepID=UPI002D77B6DF|nr:hypothetical protein [Hymenobacter sp. GOD-10R]WRQ26992.1 hypothetical protein SD425_18125 [Hymenobacter sp. GOD-10R]